MAANKKKLSEVIPIVEYIKNFCSDSSSKLRPYLAAGDLNSNYIRGNQYKKINNRTLAIEDRKFDKNVWTERKVYNRLISIYLSRFGILKANMPVPGFNPVDNTSKRVNNAVLGNNFINAFLSDTNFRGSVYSKIIKYVEIYGSCWVKTGIDYSYGNEVCKLETTTKGEKGYYIVKEGRTFVDAIHLGEVKVDNYNVDSVKEVNELVHTRPFTLSYIKARWGIDAQPEPSAKIQYGNNRSIPTSTVNSSEEEYAYVYEYYRKANSKYPKGRYVIVCGDNSIYDGPLPYKNGRSGERVIPFDLVRIQSLPGFLLGSTIYSQLIPIQDTFNKMKNRYSEYIHHISIGQLYVQDNSLINPQSIDTRPGRIIKIRRHARFPQTVEKARWSNDFIPYLQSLEEDLLVTAGLSQLSAYGISKSNMRTDGVADRITQADENKLEDAIDSLSESMVNLFKKIVYLEKQRQDFLKNKLNLAKKDTYVLKYRVEGVDVEQITIVNRDFLMQDDQAIQSKLQRLLDMGIYNPEAGLPYRTKIEMLDALRANYLKDSLNPTERATYDLTVEENISMLTEDIAPKAEEWHEHDQHIYEHNLFRMSPEVRQLKKDNAKAYQLLMEAIDLHIEEHLKFSSEANQQEVYKDAKDSI